MLLSLLWLMLGQSRSSLLLYFSGVEIAVCKKKINNSVHANVHKLLKLAKSEFLIGFGGMSDTPVQLMLWRIAGVLTDVPP